MIKIIAKGYKYLLTQIDDFLESARTIVISLKSVKGRKEYEQLFGRKLDDQKTNIKIRIISLKPVLHQLDPKIIYPHHDFKHLTEKYFEIGMKLRNDETIISSISVTDIFFDVYLGKWNYRAIPKMKTWSYFLTIPK